ncbi:MAG: hypothetical protein Q4D54_08305 [Eubacteriales bacterium]|nr:hypothetical protein [Lachnospiraceae bacterium]MDO5127737.1 hypothetical protein [Eubacteriales bacterium]
MNKQKKKSKKNGIMGLVLLFFWLMFILFTLIFYFYYWDELPFNKKSSDKAKTTVSVTEGELSEDMSLYDTVYKYETNSNPDINALMADYYSALASKDQALLKTLVMDPSEYNDMTDVLAKAAVVTNYSNINCYTLPGVTEDATIVYTVCNITILNVESKPLDIRCYYVRQTDNGYLIDNRPYDESVTEYLNERDAEADIQALYQTVQDNINKCLADDESFVSFYNRVNAN